MEGSFSAESSKEDCARHCNPTTFAYSLPRRGLYQPCEPAHGPGDSLTLPEPACASPRFARCCLFSAGLGTADGQVLLRV